MNALLKHMAVRLWAAALFGGIACLVLLPMWQRLLGVDWVILPAMILLTVSFWGCGWLMNRTGAVLTQRQVQEAAVWERAGMMVEAETAFQRAVASFDSFWMSPLKRRRFSSWITGRLARFYLAQFSQSSKAQAIVRTHLKHHPDDKAVAIGWLEHVLTRESHDREDHELAGRIGEALSPKSGIHRLLMHFYLVCRRADFIAMQTYRWVWQHEAVPDEWVRSLAQLLTNEARVSDWALKVYLQAYDLGEDAYLEAIAACVRFLRPGPQNQDELAKAHKILNNIDTNLLQRVMDRIQHPPTEPEQPAIQWLPAVNKVRRSLTSVSIHAIKVLYIGFVQSIRFLGRAPKARRMVASSLVIMATMVLVIVGWNTIKEHKGAAPPPQPVLPKQPAPKVIDPFTIQVAAYVKKQDAQHFTDQLKQHGLDAFWTLAASANRKWYQVKVSHFATKEKARQYGEQLKAKGLIDDFYVANYTP